MNDQASRFVMDPVDRAWLEMDEPGNPMVISAIFQLEGPVDAASFQKSIVERLLRYPRFRQKIDGSGSRACWVHEETLDFAYHVRVRRLPAKSGESELRRAISNEISQDLDRSKPLWRLFLYPQAGGTFTALFRAHHALADGIALVTLLIDSTDNGIRRAAAPDHPGDCKRAHDGPLGSLIDQMESLNTGLAWLTRLLRDVPKPAALMRHLRSGRNSFGAMRRILRLPDSKPEMFRKALSGHRNVAWVQGLPFAPIRVLARRLDVRVNDIFLAALAGAIGQELRRQEPGASRLPDLRVSIPVNLRQGKGRDLGNQFGLVFLELPVGMASPADRLRTVSRRMAGLKLSLEARMTFLGLAAAGHLPVPLEKRLVTMIGAKSAAVISNLPGPKRCVRIAGARMKNLVFWPPQAGGMGLGVSADRSIMPRPERLVAAFRRELEAISAIEAGAFANDIRAQPSVEAHAPITEESAEA